ncbi:sigma-54-dependent transcriptional regulator [Schlesneria sp. DSM 10557]|uniref:sigma-54-dependent transcriptional regulator n=1 Tax=Schlesneria sp. DSM 10557 TaxID=3044399 RepID=UPI00359F4389
MGKLLVIDDERNVRFSVADVFSESDIDVRTADNGEQGLQLVTDWNPDAILLDIKLKHESGLDVFKSIREIDPKAIVILMTGFGTSEVAIEAMKNGAFDYVVKPLDMNLLRDLVRQACDIRRMVQVPTFINQADRPESQPQQIVGSSPLMRNVFKQIGRVAPQNVNVLILGESGTGKELVARAIYQHSRRSQGPFLAINCAAIPENLLESELFGHEKGAFTGAHQRRIGKFEQCDGGTLFLDEIGDMAPATQAKILRLLQDGCFERIGGNELVKSDVRILAATNHDLDQLIKQGRFRRDLNYRLRGVTITLPPLRERREDVAELAHHFLFRYAAEVGSPVQTISPETLDILTHYSWPGNVRELQNIIRGALISATGTVLSPAFLPAEILNEEEATNDLSLDPISDDLASWNAIPAKVDRWLIDDEVDIYRKALEYFDQYIIGRVLRHTSDNQAQAADRLGLSRVTVRSKLRALMAKADNSPPRQV